MPNTSTTTVDDSPAPQGAFHAQGGSEPSVVSTNRGAFPAPTQRATGALSRHSSARCSRSENPTPIDSGCRKNAQVSLSKRLMSTYPRWFREYVFRRARALRAAGDTRDPSAVIYRNLYDEGHRKFSRADVSTALVGLLLELDRRWSTAEAAVNGLVRAQAIKAGDSVWSEDWPAAA